MEENEILEDNVQESCSCGCDVDCDCGDNCKCDGEHRCSEDCKCGKEENCECETCTCQEEPNYLLMAQRIQADFDNYRRHAVENITKARIDGQSSVIEAFLPCLDTFKEAKKSIADENVLKGVEMIENKILETLKDLGVEKMNSIGEVYNPHLHNVIAVMRDENQENDIILDEYQAGYKFKDKILRYAKVIVNKKDN